VDNQQVQKGRITGLKQKSKITYNKRHLKPATDLECCYCRLTPSWDNSIPCYLTSSTLCYLKPRKNWIWASSIPSHF